MTDRTGRDLVEAPQSESHSAGGSARTSDPFLHVRRRNGGYAVAGQRVLFHGHRLPAGTRDGSEGVFAGWDWDGERLRAENCRFGVYPLYYFASDTEFAISPSPMALLDHGAPAELDEAALAVLIRFRCFVGEDTPFRAIRTLPPAAELIWRDGRLTIQQRTYPVKTTELDRDAAIDAFIDTFRAAIRRREKQGRVIAPLSGGRDSRHILLELCHLGMAPDLALTSRHLPPLADEDARVATLLADRLELSHVILGAARSGCRIEMEKNRRAGFGCLEHAWFLETADYVNRHGLTVYDGLGGGTLSAAAHVDGAMVQLLAKGDMHGLAALMLKRFAARGGSEWALNGFLAPEWRRALGFDVAVARIAEELTRHVHAPNPITAFYFWNRSRRGIALAPFSLYGSHVRVYVPYLDHAVFDLLYSLPASMTMDHKLHTDAIHRAYPTFRDIPFEEKAAAAARWRALPTPHDPGRIEADGSRATGHADAARLARSAPGRGTHPRKPGQFSEARPRHIPLSPSARWHGPTVARMMDQPRVDGRAADAESGSTFPPFLHVRKTGAGFDLSGQRAFSQGHVLPGTGPDGPDGLFHSWAWDGRALRVRTCRYGAYPLCYFASAREIAISPSLIKLLELGAPREWDEAALAVLIRFRNLIGEDTPFRAIRTVPAASDLVWQDGKVEIVTRSRPIKAATMGRDEAIDAFENTFRAAIARRPRRDRTIVPLSGGQDSRHILFELCRQESRPDGVFTARYPPPKADEDARIATILADRLGLPHVIVPAPRSGMAVEVEKNRRTNFASLEHGWFLGAASYVNGHADTVYDGMAGDTLSAAPQWDDRIASHLAGGDPRGLSAFLLHRSMYRMTSEWAIDGMLSEPWRRALSLDVAVERMGAELVRHLDAPSPMGSFYFWNRNRSGTVLAPLALYDSAVTVYAPYLDHGVFNLLRSLPTAITRDRNFHKDTIHRAFPRFRDIPFETKPMPPREDPAYMRRLIRDLLWTAGRAQRGEITRMAWLAPRLVVALARGRADIIRRLGVSVFLYLHQLEETVRRLDA